MSLFLSLLKRNPLLNRAYQSADPDRLLEESYFDDLLMVVVGKDSGALDEPEPVQASAGKFIATRQLVTLLVDRSEFYKFSSDRELDAWIALWKIPQGHYRVMKDTYFFNGRRFLPTGEPCVPKHVEVVPFEDSRISVPSLEIFLTSSLADAKFIPDFEDEEPDISYFSSMNPSAFVLKLREVNRQFGFPSYDDAEFSDNSKKSSYFQGFQESSKFQGFQDNSEEYSAFPKHSADSSAFSTVRSKSKSSASKAGFSGKGKTGRGKSGVVPKVNSVVTSKKDVPDGSVRSGPNLSSGRAFSYPKVPDDDEYVSKSPQYVPTSPGFLRDKSYTQASFSYARVSTAPSTNRKRDRSSRPPTEKMSYDFFSPGDHSPEYRPSTPDRY